MSETSSVIVCPCCSVDMGNRYNKHREDCLLVLFNTRMALRERAQELERQKPTLTPDQLHGGYLEDQQ